MDWIVAIIVLVLVLGFVGWRLWRSNMEVPANAEKPLSSREALRFRLDHSLPIGRPIKSDRQQATPGIGHNGGPPLDD